MPRLLNRLALACVLLVAGNAWALGLGDIKLKSALNEPLDAEIELLSATPEELADLAIILASAETFERYGLDRPAYLQNIQFAIVRNGRDNSYIRVRSRQPMTEPFVTFLVEASWSRGRLLREYTVFLDPPTFAPPQPRQEPVAAPRQTAPRDSGRVERPAPTPTPATRTERPVSAPTPSEPAPRTSAPTSQASYSSESGDAYTVSRSETLWGIASRVRPDSRLTMNQTMLAIYRANPDAFAGNINILKEGARLRIPSADEIYRIDRGDAFSEVSRQHDSWQGGSTSSSGSTTRSDPEPIYQPDPEPVADDDSSSLVLVPPDEDSVGLGVGGEDLLTDDPVAREDEILDRLEAIESESIPEDQALLDIRNNEMARLRQELANIRGEEVEPPVTDATDDLMVDDGTTTDGPFVDDAPADDEPADSAIDDAVDTAADDAPSDAVIRARPKASLVDRALDALTSFWAIIAGAVLAALLILFWFFKRRGGDDDGSGVFGQLDDDDLPLAPDDTARTQTIPPPDQGDETIVVEEGNPFTDTRADTIEVEVPGAAGNDSGYSDVTQEMPGEEFQSLEDTFSSETAVNLDQSDPIAEADFHMAYGLYDQAADLVNGALETDPQDKDLLGKLCEIYFVWGNRDAFVDAATRVKGVIGTDDSAEWDKIVIMGQQIAADSELFAGAGVAGATKEVDLSFEAGADDGGDLDMVFGDDSGTASDDDGLDFMFDDADGGAGSVDENLEVTAESPTLETPTNEATAEMPSLDATSEAATIEQPTPGSEATEAMPSLEDAFGDAFGDADSASDETAEIDLDDLGLDLEGLDVDTGINEALDDVADETGRNLAIDPNATGVTPALDVKVDDETSEVDILAATGKTQVLPDEMKVETINEPNPLIGDDAETMLASLDDDGNGTEVLSDNDATMLAPSPTDEDFDFAKTEALPADTYDADATAETPALASTDMDLDLDDLTAALDLSEAGDTVEMPRDDATVEQPRPQIDEPTAEVPTMAFGVDDMDDDLNEARTMTEVGTKLDLARAYVDMGDPGGARSILEEVLDEGDDEQRKQAQELLDSLPS